jgi:hypothetical protein
VSLLSGKKIPVLSSLYYNNSISCFFGKIFGCGYAALSSFVAIRFHCHKTAFHHFQPYCIRVAEVTIVRDHYGRQILPLVDILENGHDFLLGLFIQIAGRFVS